MDNNEIYFKCSSIGNLMTDGKGVVFSEKDSERIDELKYELENGINKNGNKVKWTPPKAEELKKLIEKRDRKPKLSETAKREVEKIWLLNEKGYYDDLENKYLTKGLLNEDDGLGLVSEVTGNFLLKNKERKYQNNITGECDSISEIDGKKIVIDIKSSWSVRTFMNADLSNIYEWQMRAYMYLYDIEEAWLCYTLTDVPEHLIEQEKNKVFYKYYSNGMSNEEVELLDEKLQVLYKQIEMNMVYSNNPRYSKDEMIKIFKIERDKSLEEKLLERVKMGLEYYKTIRLNQI